ITPQVLSSLRERGISKIEVHPGDASSLREQAPENSPARKTEPVAPQRAKKPVQKWRPSHPVKDLLTDRHHEDLSEEHTQRLQQGMSVAKSEFEHLQSVLCHQSKEPVSDLSNISDDYAAAMVDDLDQTVGMMGTAWPGGGLAERNVRLAVLGMAVGVEMELDGPQILEIGTAALMHDVGLYAMDAKYADSTYRLEDDDLWEYQKHPLVSVKCINELMEVSHSVQLAIQQVHEQFDGSGYPRGVKGPRIHLYARILNVVDTYLQLTSPTADRRAIVPHDALGLILHQAARGIFDPQVVRAFLNTETMFPLGSKVELNNGDLAKVIRRPKSGFSAPVLKGSDGHRIELESAQVEIVRPVRDPELDEMRLTSDMMRQARWSPNSNSFVV
ncbi:MAG: HD domain-containing protein, partial [Pirellulales bacterium]|nr:HD domain-containing protein [Pirellulales bacterium]